MSNSTALTGPRPRQSRRSKFRFFWINTADDAGKKAKKLVPAAEVQRLVNDTGENIPVMGFGDPTNTWRLAADHGIKSTDSAARAQAEATRPKRKSPSRRSNPRRKTAKNGSLYRTPILGLLNDVKADLLRLLKTEPDSAYLYGRVRELAALIRFCTENYRPGIDWKELIASAPEFSTITPEELFEAV